MATYIYEREGLFLTGFDEAGTPQTTEDINEALWLNPDVDDDFDGYDIPAREAGFVAKELTSIED